MSNVFSFTGALGADAERRMTPSNQSVLNLSVAVNSGYGDNKKTLWVRCALWGKRAEGELLNYLKKGKKVFVSGELSEESYTYDGEKKTKLCVNVNLLELIDPVKNGERSDSREDERQSTPFDYNIPF